MTDQLDPRPWPTRDGNSDMVREFDGGLGLAHSADNAHRVDRRESMRLLASVGYGRVIFSLNALPAIRPVNHLVDEDQVIIRTRLTTAISAGVRSSADIVVAYEADCLDPHRQAGWSVVVTGRAHTIDDAERIARYERLLRPWVNHADTVLAIESDIVTGFRILASDGEGLRKSHSSRPPTV